MVVPYLAGLPNGGQRQYGGQPHFGVWNKKDGRFNFFYKGKTYKVAPLICEAFHGPKPEGSTVVAMHNDENSANNRANNLSWGTQRARIQTLQTGPFYRERSHRSRFGW